MVFRERRGPRGGPVAFGERGERFILRSRSGDYQLFFELRRPTRTERGLWIGLIALGAMLLVIYLCYRADPAPSGDVLKSAGWDDDRPDCTHG